MKTCDRFATELATSCDMTRAILRSARAMKIEREYNLCEKPFCEQLQLDRALN